MREGLRSQPLAVHLRPRRAVPHAAVAQQQLGGKTRHTTHLDGFPAMVRVVRASHALEGRSLELTGW
ncbi:MAG: hypothetical protein ACLP01_18515, partial [Solirubrobacteraceae bacterium]